LAGFLFLSVLAGCKPRDDEERYVITYYDRNHDGIVDFELHHLPHSADADWALSDTQFRGRYDLRLNWGIGLERKPVDMPVAKNVPIISGQPPVSPTE
jgi:hypothetical protein